MSRKKKEKEKAAVCYPLVQGTANTMGVFITDPMGSYTGVPLDPDDRPVQDADDL